MTLEEELKQSEEWSCCPEPERRIRAEHALAQAEADCLTLAFRLLDEDEDSFGPETREVMKRYRPKCEAILADPYGHV